jgi:thymidylate synthase (FAD)
MTVAKLIWITPDADNLIAMMARVSNPESAAKGENNERLISYLIRNKHWSPFEMASACFEIETTRDIARQILRHRSFSFQEFSQRYASVDALPDAPLREARLQDYKNRQNSLSAENPPLQHAWERSQRSVRDHSERVYQWALSQGIAKEVARCVLPEGLTMSRMYMSGTIRSWLHYLDLRLDAGTQKEHREVAEGIERCLLAFIPDTMQAHLENNR